MKPMLFDPTDGSSLRADQPTDPADWRPVAGTPVDIAHENRWRYNPWTGKRRDPRDIGSDPSGLLVVAPGEPLRAYKAPVEFTAHLDGAVTGSDPLAVPGEVVPPVDRRNPKSVEAKGRVPLWLLSPVAKAAWCMAQFLGRTKYGAWNWRATEVYASEYISAAMRHLDAWLSGERYDPADGTHHLGNVMACCAILLDAEAAGKLIDDRPPRVDHRPMYAECEAMVAPIEKKYANREVKHWTIADSVAPATLPTPSTNSGEQHAAALRNEIASRARAGQENREAGISGGYVPDHRV